MGAQVVIRRDNTAALLRSPTGPVYRDVDRIARRTANAAKRMAPVRSGQLRASIGSITSVDPARVTGRVFISADYAMFVLRGTGIYGPTGRVITPKRARVLRFESGGAHGPLAPRKGRKSLGAGAVVFARYVRGTPKNPFLIEAFRANCPYPVRVLTA